MWPLSFFIERGSLSNAPNPRAKKARRMRAAHLIRCTLGGDCFAQGGGFFYVGRVPSPSTPTLERGRPIPSITTYTSPQLPTQASAQPAPEWTTAADTSPVLSVETKPFPIGKLWSRVVKCQMLLKAGPSQQVW